MRSFTPILRSKIAYVLAYVVFPPVLLLVLPNQPFERMSFGWPFALVVVLPVSFFAGLLSAWLYHRRNNCVSLDPFYIRAWWSMIGGAVAWPTCLLFRPIAADIAFTLFFFGLGPVIAFHVYRRASHHSRT
jgi:uncharacterized membrane protein YfcA